MKRINEAFFMRPWAVKEDIFQKMLDIVERHVQGEKLTREEIQDRISDKKEKPDYEVINGIARIPVYGIIAKRMSQVQGISQPTGTSIEEIKRDLRAAIGDPAVEKIVLDIDSPGGSVDGVAEFSDYIYSLRGTKPIIAFADGQMASAAYFIGSAAGKVYASKSAEVGSIGVYAVVTDWSVSNHISGLKVEIIKAGKYKATGHPDKPFMPEDRQVIQKEVDKHYNLFMEAVGRNRDMTEEEVREIATGETWVGKEAAELDLVDGIKTIEEVLELNGDGGSNTPSTRAGNSGLKIDNNQTKKEESMDLTLEKVKAEHKLIADALIAEGRQAGITEGKQLGIVEGKQAGLAEGETAGAKKAQDAEALRVKGITEAMPQGMEAVALNAIKEGKTLEDAKDMYLKSLQKAAPASPGASADPDAGAQSANLSPKEKAEAEFDKNPDLQREFTSRNAYVIFRIKEEEGHVHILQGKK